MEREAEYWEESGHGIDGKILKRVDIKTQVAFIEKYLPDAYAEMVQDVASGVNPVKKTARYYNACRDWILDYEDECGYCGFVSIFADAINENEEDFCVEHSMSESDEAIIFMDREQEEMSDREKGMSKDEVREVFARYLRDVNIVSFKFDKKRFLYVD